MLVGNYHPRCLGLDTGRGRLLFDVPQQRKAIIELHQIYFYHIQVQVISFMQYCFYACHSKFIKGLSEKKNQNNWVSETKKILTVSKTAT